MLRGSTREGHLPNRPPSAPGGGGLGGGITGSGHGGQGEMPTSPLQKRPNGKAATMQKRRKSGE